jgi:hypothetical protein
LDTQNNSKRNVGTRSSVMEYLCSECSTQLNKSFENDLDIYDYPKYIAKLKKQEEENKRKEENETN